MESILDEAKRIIYGDREEAYGDPGANVRSIASFWSIIVGVPLTADQVCLMMIAMKVARLMHKPDHRDSLVDIPGYAALMERIQNHNGGAS